MEKGTSKVALYVRVSTGGQDLEGQERDLQAYATSRGWEITATYREKLTANGTVERPVYERLLRDASDPERVWGHVLVWSLDRWSRSIRFTDAVRSMEDVEALGVKFHSYREPMIDSSEDGTPNMGRDLLRAILPVIATFESRRRAERVSVAMRELKEGRRQTRSGKPWHRPIRVTPEKLEALLKLRSQGKPWATVAQAVGLPANTCKSAAWKVRKQKGYEKNPLSLPCICQGE
jgi:DNA invertase Pin-like site-specific DNA recombinase